MNFANEEALAAMECSEREDTKTKKIGSSNSGSVCDGSKSEKEETEKRIEFNQDLVDTEPRIKKKFESPDGSPV